MSDLIDKARPAAALALMDSKLTMFTLLDQMPRTPCALSLPGSASMNLMLFKVTATGVAKAAVPGMVTLTLLGRPDLAGTTDPAVWLPLSSSLAEPIGGETDLPEAMFMVQGADLMVNTGTGKLQGVFRSNVASHPQAAIDLEQHPGDITPIDPLYVFALAASFEPTVEESRRRAGKADAPALCTLTLASFTLSA